MNSHSALIVVLIDLPSELTNIRKFSQNFAPQFNRLSPIFAHDSKGSYSPSVLRRLSYAFLQRRFNRLGAQIAMSRHGFRFMRHLNEEKHCLVACLLAIAVGLLIFGDELVPRALAQSPASINAVVVEGDGTASRTRQQLAHDPVVRVEDDDHRPVPGAAVVFALPAAGTTGEFPNGSKILTVVTDKNGLAAARGVRTNDVPGRLQIYTTASYRGLRAQALINQFVEAAPGAKPLSSNVHLSKSGSKWKWAVLALAAAGGAGAAVYFQRRSSSSTPSIISIGTGPIVFGSPH